MLMKTYWRLIHCRWVKVTTSLSVWAGLPHVSKLAVSCLATGLLFGPSTPPTIPTTIPPTAQPAPSADDGGLPYVPGLEGGSGFAFSSFQTVPTGGGYVAPHGSNDNPSNGSGPSSPIVGTSGTQPVGPSNTGSPGKPGQPPPDPTQVPDPDMTWVFVAAGLLLIRLHTIRRVS